MASLKDQHYHIKFFMLSVVIWGLCTILNKMCIENKFLWSSNEVCFQNILLVTEVAHTVEGGGCKLHGQQRSSSVRLVAGILEAN